VFWQLGDNVEVSFNVKTELFVEFSFTWLTLPFIYIHNVPLLINSTMGCVDNDVLLLSVNSTLYIENFSVLDVSDESAFFLEELPPS
jgi:hypothetical protein